MSITVRRFTLRALRSAALLLLACASAAASGGALIADTPETTAAGTPFTAPKGWSVEINPGLAVMTAPEGNLRMAVVDVPAASNAADAVAKGWLKVDPKEHHALKIQSPLATIDGWDEREQFEYEVSLSEKIFLQARALRKGTDWVVMIVQGADGTAEKRLGALALLRDTLLPPRFAKENFAGKPAKALGTEQVALLRGFVREAMEEIGIPGVGLAFIDHGEVVFEGGEGIRELGKPRRVDAHTLFAIASNTKGMSTLLLAELVDQGKLKWDQPVTEVYPGFRLGSPTTTAKVLIRHLVCACTGLPRKDYELLFDTDKRTPASDTFKQLAATEPTSGFGEVFQYNNLMASAAGYIGAHVYYPKMELGAAYDKAMQEKIFKPLGMTDTVLDIDVMLRRDHASPHAYTIDGTTALGPIDGNYTFQPFRPAGGAWSSAHDMIRYVDNELRQGLLPDGRRLVSAENLLMRRKPNVPTGEHSAYGMGLQTDSTWGVEVVHHGGSLFGYKSDIVFVPEADVGAVVLTNSDEGYLMLKPFMRRLLEVLYDGRPEAVANLKAAVAQNKAYIASERARLSAPPDPVQVARLAAHYRSADLGELAIVREGATVIADTGLWKSPVATRKNDDGTISLISTEPTLLGFEWVIGERNGKRALITRDSQHDYVFLEE
jgi:CubicO group peptidase (beta-lactamase class C family)